MIRLVLSSTGYAIVTFMVAYIIASFTTDVSISVMKICAAIACLGFVISMAFGREKK